VCQKTLRKEKVEPRKKHKHTQTNFKETWALPDFLTRISQAGVRVLSQKPKFSRPIYRLASGALRYNKIFFKTNSLIYIFFPFFSI